MEKKEKTFLDLLKNLIIAIALVAGLVYGFFNLYLPWSTNQGETITVPNLEGMNIEEVQEFLEKRSLKYEVEPDSGYSAKYPPLAVLKQFPLPHSKVKENRKLYLTLNNNTPPTVRIPDLGGRSLKNALLELKSRELYLGELTYISGQHFNTIAKLYHNGRLLQEKDSVPKGSKIDIVANNGLGNQVFDVPNLTGLDLEEAEFAIRGTGLKVGGIYFEIDGMAKVETENEDGRTVWKEIAIDPGQVFKQKPNYGRKTRTGEVINIWIVKQDSTSLMNQPNLNVIDE